MSSQACAKVGTTMSWDDHFHDGDALIRFVWPFEEMSGGYLPFGRSSNLAINNQQIHKIQHFFLDLAYHRQQEAHCPPFSSKKSERERERERERDREICCFSFTTGNQWKGQQNRKPKGWILYPPCLEDKSTYLLLEIFIKTIGTCTHCCGLLRNPAPLGRWITGTFHIRTNWCKISQPSTIWVCLKMLG